jgi:hypothetical protein
MVIKSPSILFIDAETSGLWKKTLSYDDSQQPWIVSCAFALCEPDGNFINHGKFLIKPDGRTIQSGAENVHGITTREASQFGIPEARFLGVMGDLLKTMPLESYIRVISYGEFDSKVLGSLFARFAISQGKPSSAFDRLWLRRPYVEFIDLMQPWCQMLCKLPSGFDDGSYKWPSLDEAAETILGREPRVGTHNAWEDMLILRDLYLRFRELGHFKEREAA